MPENDDENRLGALLRHRRKELGFTQEELEKRSGVSQSTITHIESGKRKGMGGDVLARICQALDVPMDYFVSASSPGVTVPPPPSLVPIPLPIRQVDVTGIVGAGPPVDYAIDDELDFDMALRVQGDSMEADGLHHGDEILLRCDPEPKAGEEVVAWIASEHGHVVKWLVGRHNQRLESDDGYRHVLTGEDRILGSVVRVLRKRKPRNRKGK